MITNNEYKNVVFVLDNIEEYDVMASHIPLDTFVFVIDSQKNALLQMENIVSDMPKLKSLHIFSHGNSGELNFGSTKLSLETLPIYSNTILKLANALTKEGELYLYGCEVAAGERGAAFVEMLGDITGLKVAAATHKVGHAELGGSWELDMMPEVMSGALAVSEWRGVLAGTTSTTKTGYIVLPVSSVGREYSGNMIIDANGKIVFAGGGFDDTDRWNDMPGYIVRLDPTTGEKDTSFSTDGIATVSPEFLEGIVAHGTGYLVFGDKVTKIKADGTIDTDWGTNGIYTTPTTSVFSAVTLSDGSVLVQYGEAGGGKITKLTSTGALDTSWGTSGVISNSIQFASDLIELSDGSFLVSGHIFLEAPTYYKNWKVEKFNADGTPDNTFGTGGSVVINIHNDDYKPDMVVDSDGNILLTGYTRNGYISLVRLTSDGAPDTTFGENKNGFVILSTGATSEASKGIALQSDGKIILAGYSDDSITVTRLNTDGTLDETFGNFGTAFAQIGGDFKGPASGWRVGVQSDGKIVVQAGVVSSDGADTNTENDEWMVATRFNTDGTLDTTFGESETTTSFTLNISDAQTWYRPTPDRDNSTAGLGGDDYTGVFDVVIEQEIAVPDVREAYNYAFVEFTPATTGLYDIKIGSTTIGDPMFFIYDGTFDPTAPATNFDIGDDDSANEFGFSDSQGDHDNFTGNAYRSALNDISLTANTTYTLVVTSFEPADAGDITFSVSGPAGVTLGEGSFAAEPVTPYISGKEQMVINEDANGELAISGFSLGNANDMNDTTTELTVSITAAHGTLRLTETGGITYSFTNDGTDTTIEFSGTIANLRTAVNSLRYDPVDDNTAADPLEIKISADDGATWQPYTVDVEGKFYYAPNGHYYEFVEDNGIHWEDAKADAEAKTLYGLNGYLATVTSEAENDYIAPKLGGDGWMGASDAASEGVWKWVTGPETGTHFFNGYTGAGTGSYRVEDGQVYVTDENWDESVVDGVNGTTVNVAVGSNYENWAEGEPNNSDENGGEDFAHFYGQDDNSGKWNDYHNENWDIQGYIVEYGGEGFGTLQGANLTIVTNLKPVLSDVVAGPIAAGTESNLQTTPLRLDDSVTLVEDNYTMNWTGEEEDYEPVCGRIDVFFVNDDGYNIGLYGSNEISIVSNGDITVTNEDIFYKGSYIGQVSGGINGNFAVIFDTRDTVTAAMVEKVIESITYTVNDAPVAATKLRYVVTDNTGLSSTPVDVVVNVTAENDAPTLTTSTGLIRSNITLEGWDDAKSVVTLSDGSIIVAGDADGTIKLAKYDANGALVSGFGSGGIVETELSGDFYSPSIALDSDGKIVVVAADDDSGNVVAMRYSSTGTLDTTFAAGSGNVAVVAEYGYYPKVAVLADNSIAVSFVGETYYEPLDEYFDAGAVAKLTSLGVLDENFGEDGIQQITTPGSFTNEINDIMVSGTNILVTGGDSVYDPETDDEADNVFLAILNGTTGALSVTTTAAESGDVWSDLDSTVEGSAIGKQSNGKIIVAGTADEDGVILARYNTDGTLDTTFGTNGKAAFTMFDEAQDIAIDSNDKIVVLNDGDIEVARILADGSALDPTFGEGGVVTINGSTDPWGAELKIASNGTIWVVGGDDDADDGAFTIAKLSANGVPDANFISKATYTVSGEAVVLDGAISVYDGELSDDNNYNGFEGATLSIARDGGANAHDVFSAAAESYLSFDGANVVYDGSTVGTFIQAGGTLTITFNSSANRDNINDIMRSIAYENTDETITEATTVDLKWTFSDGNTAAQGTGDALTDTLVQTVNMAIPEAGDDDTTEPTITSTPVTTVDEGAQYNYTLSATDEGDVTWSVKEGESLPDWLTLGKGDAAVTIADDFTDPGGMAYDDATGDIYATYNSYVTTMFVEDANRNLEDGQDPFPMPQPAIYKIAEDGTKTLFTNVLPGQVGSMVVDGNYLYAGFADSGYELLARYDLRDTDGDVTAEVILQGGNSLGEKYYDSSTFTGLAKKDGSLYAVDYDNGKILKFDLSNIFAAPETYVEGLAGPYGIAFDTEGNLYGTSLNGASVFEYDGADVSIVMSVNGDGATVLHGAPTDIKIDADGNFYISHFPMFGPTSGIYKYNSDFVEQSPPISTTANTWSMLLNSEGKIIAGDVQIDEATGTVSGEIFGIDTANYSLTGTAPSVDADTPTEITLVATDEAGNETEHTFTITVNDVPVPTSSVTLNVANPFTADAEDTTEITIDAPEGINISNATNSAVSGLPKNVKMPLGQFGFTLSGLEDGATVEMSMTADADFKQFSYFKKNLVTQKWVNIAEGTTINEDGTATVKFSLTDGGVYDADRTVNGVIVDPGGVGENALLPMIAENTTEVGNISLLDNTAAVGTLSYAITGGEDAAKFTISSTTGLLSFNTAPDYENPTDTGDTAANNTYAVQVTVTGSTSGSEVQNLIVTVLNVEEDGDNLNTAPVIVGLRAEAQEVIAGTAAALDDIRVVDANNMGVTLTATNGTIGGLTDADPVKAGIQLTGNATTINTALAAATFTATAAGAAGVSISVTDAPGAGTAITTTGYYAMTAAAAPAPTGGGSTTTPTSTTTVDGATVQTSTTTETRTTTDANGNTVTTTVTVEELIIAPVSDNRTDSTGTVTTADIPLFWGESTRTEWATTASLPTGVGLTSEGSRAPAGTQTVESALADLIYYIDITTPETDPGKANILGGGERFLQAMNNVETLIVNKLTLTTNTDTSLSTPITINGTVNTVQTVNGEIAPVEALVIDASSIQQNTTIELKNVEFAVIVGENIKIRGGDGQNKLFAGKGSQDIMLGADDDELYAGSGDDIVGSAGGNDIIFGEGGNDILFDSDGINVLHGGIDTDFARYDGNITDYIISRDHGKTYVSSITNPGHIDTLVNIESIEFSDGNYTIENSSSLVKIASLYNHVLDRQADLDGFQYWANNAMGMGQIALGFINSNEFINKSGIQFNTLSIEDKIETFYEAFLGRTSDEEGKLHWINHFTTNALSIEEIANHFIDSMEMQQIYTVKEEWDFFI